MLTLGPLAFAAPSWGQLLPALFGASAVSAAEIPDLSVPLPPGETLLDHAQQCVGQRRGVERIEYIWLEGADFKARLLRKANISAGQLRLLWHSCRLNQCVTERLNEQPDRRIL